MTAHNEKVHFGAPPHTPAKGERPLGPAVIVDTIVNILTSHAGRNILEKFRACF